MMETLPSFRFAAFLCSAWSNYIPRILLKKGRTTLDQGPMSDVFVFFSYNYIIERILSVKYWLFDRDPNIMVYEIIPT